MRRRLPLALAMPAAIAILGLAAGPTAAATAYPTTPVPQPANPSNPPASAPNGPQPLRHAVGDAGAGLAVLRLLPDSVTTKTILPGGGQQVPKQSTGELGFGLSSAQLNSESYLAYEHAVAQSAPMGLAFQGGAPQLPGALTQTAPPDNTQPTTAGLHGPENPILNVGAMKGSVHARWSDAEGPCTGPTRASTSVASLDLLNVIPNLGSLGSLTDLSKIFDLNKVRSQLGQRQADAAKTAPALPGPLAQLGGLLPAMSSASGDKPGSVVSLPDTLSSHATVQLVDMPGAGTKAVRSTSTLQVSGLQLLRHTPFQIDIKIVSPPKLVVTSTGEAKTSTVKYTAAVLKVAQGGKTLFTLDAAHPTASIPIALPLPGLDQRLPDNLKGLPIIGSLADAVPGAPRDINGLTLPLGVIKLSIAQQQKAGQALTAGENGAPFTGYQIGATTRMLDVQILPTDLLRNDNLPAALAEVSLGELVGRAYAPTGGVVCATAPAAAAQPPQPHASPPLAYTAGAYEVVPMFWTGTGMLLAGAMLVAALPRRRRHRS